MNDKTTTTNNSDEQSSDYLLKSMVKTTNETHVGWDITFAATGIILTGTIVSGHEYTVAIGEALATATWIDEKGRKIDLHSAEKQEEIKNQYKAIADEIYPKKPAKTDESNGANETVTTYIHLKNVQPVIPSADTSINYNQFPYWRFRLSEISGWTLGRAERD